MKQTDIDKVRGALMAKGWNPQRIADHFDVGRGAIYNVISGDSVSARIQNFIEQQIGYWPWTRQRGEAKRV